MEFVFHHSLWCCIVFHSFDMSQPSSSL
jgi:hypothetical protein